MSVHACVIWNPAPGAGVALPEDRGRSRPAQNDARDVAGLFLPLSNFARRAGFGLPLRLFSAPGRRLRGLLRSATDFNPVPRGDGSREPAVFGVLVKNAVDGWTHRRVAPGARLPFWRTTDGNITGFVLTPAAASLTQDRDPETVVRDDFDAAGLSRSLTQVEVTNGINLRQVMAAAAADTMSHLMHVIGRTEFEATGRSVAEQRITKVEIGLVLNVSGSIGENDRLTNLRSAARAFVAVVGAAQSAACASPPSRYVNAAELQIATAFGAIATNTSQLRLSQ